MPKKWRLEAVRAQRRTLQKNWLPDVLTCYHSEPGGKYLDPQAWKKFSQGCISIRSQIRTGSCSAQKIQIEFEIAGMRRRKKLWGCGGPGLNLTATKWTNSCCRLYGRIHRFLSVHRPTLQQIPLHLDFCWNPDTLIPLLKLTTQTTAVRKRLTEWWIWL